LALRADAALHLITYHAYLTTLVTGNDMAALTSYHRHSLTA